LRGISFSLFLVGASIRFCALCGSVAALAIIALAVRPAPSIKGLINEASGRFLQYFFGISLRIAATFSRAGLKIEA
jgi:hypothetical protein